MSKITLAIDPGKSGGFAWHHTDKPMIVTGQLPEEDGGIMEWLSDLRSQADSVELHIEKVAPHTGNLAMASAMSNLYGGKRFIEGYAAGIGMRVVNVSPKKWQKHFSFGPKKKKTVLRKGVEVQVNDEIEWKNRLKSEAKRRFPGIKITLDNADAVLILDHAMSTPSLL